MYTADDYPDVPESIWYYYAQTEGAFTATDRNLYDYIVEEHKDKWTEEMWDEFQTSYDFYKTDSIGREYDIQQKVYGRLNELQEIEDLAARYEGREPKWLGNDPVFVEKLQDQASKLVDAEYENYWATHALENLMWSHGDQQDDLSFIAAKYAESERINEAIERRASESPLTLVRGAPLRCDCGTHTRYLNLPLDHGVETQELQIIYEKDAEPEQHICWFGHCTAPNHPPETVRLRAFTPVDKDGNYMHKADDSTSVGYKCCPAFSVNRWKNVKEDVKVYGSSDDIFRAVATMQSYIMCIHGGLISPVESGQLEYRAYVPPYSYCPFERNFDESSNYMSWCSENNICPYDPGSDEYDDWYIQKMNQYDVATTNTLLNRYDELVAKQREYQNKFKNSPNGLSMEDENALFYISSELSKVEHTKEIWDKEAIDTIYNDWLKGQIDANALENRSEAKLDNMRSLYYSDRQMPELSAEMDSTRKQYGSLEKP